MRRLRRLYSYIRRRIFRLGPSSNALQAQVTDLNNRYHSLVARQNAMQAYYEQRVDLIYRQVTNVLRQVLEDQHVTAETSVAIDERYRQMFSSGFLNIGSLDQVRIGELISGEMERGLVKSPLTFHGFRVDARLARDEGDAIRVFADATGLAVYGPYLRLSSGDYTLQLEISPVPRSTYEGSVQLDVYSPAANRVAGSIEARVDERLKKISIAFHWGAQEAGGEFVMRLYQHSSAELLLRTVALE